MIITDGRMKKYAFKNSSWMQGKVAAGDLKVERQICCVLVLPVGRRIGARIR